MFVIRASAGRTMRGRIKAHIEFLYDLLFKSWVQEINFIFGIFCAVEYMMHFIYIFKISIKNAHY